MKNLLLIFLFPLSLFGQSADELKILENMQAFSKAVMARDVDFITGSYTEDASIFPNGTGIITGHSAIRAYWTPSAGDTTKFHRIYPEEITIVENTAYDYGYYEVSGVTQGRPYDKVRGKYVIVWKNVAGEWKMHLDIWNRVNKQ